MAAQFPEITTVGTLFEFARALEEEAARILEAAAREAGEDEARAKLEGLLRKHQRRAADVIRAKKDKVNETVLEPLTSMSRDEYAPSLPEETAGLGVRALCQAAGEIEERSAKFYTDATAKAGHVLAGVSRMFTRLAKENGKNAATLKDI